MKSTSTMMVDLGGHVGTPAARLPLGHTWVSQPREITERDLQMFTLLSGDDNSLHTGIDGAEPIMHGTFGQALFTGFVQQLGLAQGAVALLDTNWRYRAPIFVGDILTCLITHTRVRTTSTAGRVVIHRHVELRNQRDETVQTGTSALLAQTEPGTVPPLSADPGSPSWGRSLAGILESDAAFTSATANYDGTIGLGVGETEVTFRIYKGRIIDVTRRGLNGSDFTQWIPENVWWELMTAKDNELMKQTMRGKVRSTGNGAEYLRMTKVLNLILDAARVLNKEDNLS